MLEVALLSTIDDSRSWTNFTAQSVLLLVHLPSAVQDKHFAQNCLPTYCLVKFGGPEILCGIHFTIYLTCLCLCVG